LESYLQLLEELKRQRARLQAALKQLCDKQRYRPLVASKQRCPGVGWLSVIRFTLEWGELSRFGARSGRAWRLLLGRVLHRRHVCAGKKRGPAVGNTKRGKGTKIMAIADGAGLPLACCATSASPHEVTLVETTLEARFTERPPMRLIGDRAYDSDALDERLRQQEGVLLIAPHKKNRKKPKTQDGRELRRYLRRWKIERLFAWLFNCRRLVVRYERHLENFLGFIMLGCMRILLRHF
jgi:transposase